MLKPTDTKILPVQHQAGTIAAAVQPQQHGMKEPQQPEAGSKAGVEERRKKKLIGPLLILDLLTLPGLVFAECPQPPWAPGLGWLYEFPNNRTVQIGDALAPTGPSDLSVISLIVLFGIVVNRGTSRESIQLQRNDPQTRQTHRL